MYRVQPPPGQPQGIAPTMDERACGAISSIVRVPWGVIRWAFRPGSHTGLFTDLCLFRAAGCESNINGIGNIGVIESAMNKGTLPLNALQVLMHIAIENLIDMGKVE